MISAMLGSYVSVVFWTCIVFVGCTVWKSLIYYSYNVGFSFWY
jgi:hypothetical protein